VEDVWENHIKLQSGLDFTGRNSKLETAEYEAGIPTYAE
jgi:hypothetical protein